VPSCLIGDLTWHKCVTESSVSHFAECHLSEHGSLNSCNRELGTPPMVQYGLAHRALCFSLTLDSEIILEAELDTAGTPTFVPPMTPKLLAP
jgi:hypothetical protein